MGRIMSKATSDCLGKLKKAALLLVIGTITSKGGLEVTRDEEVHSCSVICDTYNSASCLNRGFYCYTTQKREKIKNPKLDVGGYSNV